MLFLYCCKQSSLYCIMQPQFMKPFTLKVVYPGQGKEKVSRIQSESFLLYNYSPKSACSKTLTQKYFRLWQ